MVGLSAQAALATGGLGAAAKGLTDPLLSNPSRTTDSLSSDDDDGSGSSDDAGTPKPSPFTGRALATGLVAVGGVGASALALAVAPGALTAVMGAVCLWNAPNMARNGVEMGKKKSVRDNINMMREQRDHLADEVDFMAESVDSLQEESNALQDLERNLAVIADQQNTNVQGIVALVNENEYILGRLKAQMRQMFVQTMLQIVMRSDDDGDMRIDQKEVHMLSLRLKIQMEPFGVKLDTERFEAMIKEDNSIKHVCQFCGTLLFQDEAGDDDDDDSVDSDATPDLEAFCQGLGDSDDEDPPMTYEEKVGMLSVSDKYSKGSVEVARGGRMTVVKKQGGNKERRKTLMKEVQKRQQKSAARPRPAGRAGGLAGRARAPSESLSESESESESSASAASPARRRGAPRAAQGSPEHQRKRSAFKRVFGDLGGGLGGFAKAGDKHESPTRFGRKYFQ